MKNRWYWTFKYILIGPFLHLWNRPVLEGKEKIPNEGPLLIASNHQTMLDSFYFPLMVDRQLTHPAKSEYFTSPGIKGAIQRWFFTTVGQIPIHRESNTAGDELEVAAKKVFDKGDAFCIYPEGTRAPDPRVYRGRTGVARIGLPDNLPIMLAAMIDTARVNPVGTWIPRPFKIHMKVSGPFYPRDWAIERGLDPDSREASRALTDYIMVELAKLAGMDYVDAYASDVKKSLAAGDGYPPEVPPYQG